MRVVFFGTPEFAVPSLLALVGEGFDVEAVVTPPDKPQGRSRSALVPCPVKDAALVEGLPVLQPERPSDPEFLRRITEISPDVGVVVAYGHILKPDLLAIPRRGMVNVHPSLLPQLRGAAPIEWAVVNGLEKTGVTIMLMEAGLDSGPILHQLPERIPPDATGGELSTHLAEMGAQALIEALGLWEQEAITPVPQHHDRATYAPKITRAAARVVWDRPANIITRAIRGFDPRPGAWAELDGREVKLFSARTTDARGAPGIVLQADDALIIAAGEGAIDVAEVQPAGKPRMDAAAWIRGRGVAAGQRFT
ncbi:MAG TPA: methionyl-tRNA formyltransferase [Gemmatimonadales bacterium]|nr:methionyl-tRNA formyltransferase [Gemmatimonadales bacterium]